MRGHNTVAGTARYRHGMRSLYTATVEFRRQLKLRNEDTREIAGAFRTTSWQLPITEIGRSIKSEIYLLRQCEYCGW